MFALGTSMVAEATSTPSQPPVITDSSVPAVYLLGRDDCGYCKAEIEFLTAANIPYTYLDVVNDEVAKEQFAAMAVKHDIPKVTPITVIGGVVLQGWSGSDTTGKLITDARQSQVGSPYASLELHLANAPKVDVVAGKGCDVNGIECDSASTEYVFDLPFVGLVDLKILSLFTLSLVLGIIDGFNPCAMWVLITFLVLLMQAGSKQKMIVLAGLFILAEAIMYNLILNVWYKTWDFVALDQIVTPMVGLLAMGGGTFFLWRWYKNREVALVCDITSIDSQSRTIDKLKKVIHAPLTLTTLGAILLIAFSVNIIEFACSIGIPQAYTKILELNMLTFLERQWFILVYTFGYMVDDFVVFGLAIWGFSRLEAHGHKYAQLSLVIGGVLMLLLGALLTFAPSLLVL
jgi:glutaredoxin/cytochrome c biogenesis protein CcdA